MHGVFDRLKTALADRYTIEQTVGSGGMATVYLARDLKHQRHVAVKVLRPELAAALGSERFLREIRVTANLQHPHILPLYDSGEANGFLYYVMPYVEGESLRDCLNRQPQLAIDQALRITEQVASALDFAHRHDVIHRDIKPENILLHEGEAMVADFGISLAVSAAGGERLTETGFSLGTPEYMSPEQATAERVDGRTDTYSLACVLYEMLTGEPPYGGTTAQAILAKRFSDPVPSARRLRESIPVPMDSAITRALARTPADRFTDAKDFAAALTMSAVEVEAETVSIAVLPFANLSPNPDDEYLSDGISEEIINSLAHVPDLKVIARTSVFAFKGTNDDVRDIGARLGVNRVLEGSVRRSGQKLRVTAQLIRAADGQHIWSERFDRGSEDAFAIQDEIAAAVVQKLSSDIAPSSQARQSGGTANPEAYELYLRGRYYLGRATDEWVRKAADCFEQACSLDPSFAQAYAAYAGTQVFLRRPRRPPIKGCDAEGQRCCQPCDRYRTQARRRPYNAGRNRHSLRLGSASCEGAV
jgi:serine/threonine protein kinase